MGGFYLFIRSPSFGKSEATWEYYIAVVTWILVVCRWIRCSYFKIFLSFCLISTRVSCIETQNKDRSCFGCQPSCLQILWEQ